MPIVISTWNGETDDCFRRKCQECNIIVLENPLPKKAGFGHLNYQIFSSFYGIQYLSQNTDINYVLKCRTDQRINRKDFLLHFKSLLKLYPPLGEKLQLRLCFLGIIPDFPFFIADFLAFGSLSDMGKLYEKRFECHEADYLVNHNQRFEFIREQIGKTVKSFTNNHYEGFTNFIDHNKRLKKLNRIVSKFINAEVFISRSFYERHVAPVNPESIIQQYASFLKNYVVIADDLLLYWQKYDRDRLKCFNYTSDYMEWLNFYMNYNPNEPSKSLH